MSTTTTTPGDWQPKAIVFDLLTGLLDSWTLWDACTPSQSPSEGRPWRHRYLELTFSLPGGSYVPYEDCVHQAARDVGLPSSAPETLLRNWSELKPWPEVPQTLLALRNTGYKLGVVTNCSRVNGQVAISRAEQAAAELAGASGFVFDTTMTAEESGFYKPVRKAYTALLDKMGIPPEDVLFVAGSPGDVQGANDAGMRVVWHNKAGLPKKGNGVTLRTSSSLDDALKDFM